LIRDRKATLQKPRQVIRPSSELDPEALVIRQQDVERVRHALEALPPEDQAHFRFGDKLSVEDFAFYAQHIANDLIESATSLAPSTRSQPRRTTRKVKSAQ